MNTTLWGSIITLSRMDFFRNLNADIQAPDIILMHSYFHLNQHHAFSNRTTAPQAAAKTLRAR
jgi:hypothetical protein